MAEPQGTEAKQLHLRAQAALKHYHQRSEYLLAQSASDEYASVPFEPVRKVRVIYKHVGELKPLPYPLDE
ncbi:MAG: hypothetical protein HY040_13310 [Planctomycetes bacterium]|nr:hypothetical protein [Planctomycetota bacterium]